MATNILALDIGEKRIGVARVNLIARLPKPLTTLANSDDFISELDDLIKEWDTDLLVVGLPRNLKGEETAQSQYTKDFIAKKLQKYKVAIQDETLSTKAAIDRGVDSDTGVDAGAACIILEDYLSSTI